MSEEIDGQQAGGEQEPAAEFKPITSQDELEKVLGKRLERERAKFADYDDLKARATKWAEVEESQKSEVQKALERAEAAEKRASELERTTLRRSIADELGVPVEAVHGDDADSMRASAEAVKQWAEQG